MTQLENSETTGYKEIFFDDFTDQSLNREHWNVVVTGEVHNNEQQAYVDSVDTIYIETDYEPDANGVLVIHPRFSANFHTKNGKRFDFISGRINSRGKVEFSDGRISARIKMPAGVGLWPAFWLLGQGAWPECGEIDIMEYIGEPDWISAAVHGKGFSEDAALVNYLYFPADNDVTKWHEYSVELHENSYMEFNVDDMLIYRVTKPMVEYFGPWVFDQPKHIILNFALGGGYPHKITGIKKPYFGLPEETVQAIRKNDVRFLVDWVRISHY